MSQEEDLFESIVTDEIVDDETTPSAEEQAQAESDRAFESGVARALGEQQEDNTPEPTTQPTMFAGITEDDFKSLVEKANRVGEIEKNFKALREKTNGSLGGLKQSIDELRNRPAGNGKPKVTKETFKALNEYFGDEAVSEALANDFAGIEYGEADNSGFNQESLEAMRARIKAEVEAETDAKLLSIAHPDWEPLITKEWQTDKDVNGNEFQRRVFTDEFMSWTDTLKEDGKRAVFESNDPIALSKALTKFKDWRNKKEEVANKKRERLENAIVVDGGNRPSATSAESAFNQGLKKVLSSKAK